MVKKGVFMAKLRNENLKYLLNDMRKKEWTIDSFPFEYNKHKTIVILTLYTDKEKKPNEYALAKVKFVRYNNTNDYINAYIDFFEVHFENTMRFVEFFGIQNKNANRDLFLDFASFFAPFIPKEKVIIKQDENERLILGGHTEGNDPNAIYCYDVRRSGLNKDGNPKHRRPENSNKAQILRPNLYEMYKDDTTLSFYFCNDPFRELRDEEIMFNVAKR